MNRLVPKVGYSVVAACLALFLIASLAQAAPDNPTVSFTLPAGTSKGDTISLKARLVDSAGAPIPDASIYFTVPSTFFLGATSDVLVARDNTDKDGWAEAEYAVRVEGRQTIRAEYRGSERYSPVKTNATLDVSAGPAQLYVQEAGVHIPGLTSPPSWLAGGQSAERHESPNTGIASLWPMISFWPIGLALLIVWSLYAFVALQLVRIANSARQSIPLGVQPPRQPLGGSRRAPYDEVDGGKR